MRRLLAIDAGITTGWALYEDRQLREHGAIPMQLLPEAAKGLRKKLNIVSDQVIVELTMPYKKSRLGKKLTWVHRVLAFYFPNAEPIEAWQWKNSPAQKVPCPRGITQHERDAIRMGAWWLTKED